MSRAQAESVIKNIIREIAQECSSKGQVVSETLVAFMVGVYLLFLNHLFSKPNITKDKWPCNIFLDIAKWLGNYLRSLFQIVDILREFGMHSLPLMPLVSFCILSWKYEKTRFCNVFRRYWKRPVAWIGKALTHMFKKS